MEVAIVGSGVSGLTCGVRLLEAGAGPVTIVTREAPADTTSAVAGAVWFPYRVTPNERTGPWAAASYERFAALAEDPHAPVTMVEVTMLYPEPLAEEPWWLAAVPGERVRATPAGELPADYGDGRSVRVPCVEAPAYLDWLRERFTALGGRIELRAVGSLDELAAPVVVNCSGHAAGALTGDAQITPVRGQVAYVRSDRRLRFMVDEEGANALAYVLPRPDVVVLGGTAEEGDTEPRPRAATTRSILERTRRLQPELADAELIGAAVGFRPGRAEVRLEAEPTEDGRLVVHDYGHGGSGFTLSWGCADEVVGLVL
ncbi:MAG: D-amino-acid oxidase [Thermoleophilaceae bacterium]|nr:D-amino-acid oxidase [Thermoleophilaceae bacterium]